MARRYFAFEVRMLSASRTSRVAEWLGQAFRSTLPLSALRPNRLRRRDR